MHDTILIFTAPTSSTNPDDEDIDIVGDDGNNNKNNSGNLSSSESSRDLQLHVYGPPQFTEADVLACMNELDDDKKSETAVVKREVASPALSGSASAEDEEPHTHNNEAEDTKPQTKMMMQDKSKCSKCLVSF